MRDRFVSPQVRILLERMDMYPDEFVHPFESRNVDPKWHGLLHNGAFGTIESFLIKRKYNALRRKVTRDLIMSMIMHHETEEPLNYFFDAVSRAVGKVKNHDNYSRF